MNEFDLIQEFQVEIDGDSSGTLVIPMSIFSKQPQATESIIQEIDRDAKTAGMSFYISTVSVQDGIRLTWGREFHDAIPRIEDEESLTGEGLVYILRKVGDL